MKHFKSAVASAFIFTCAFVQAQDNSVGINTSSPNSNAVLELVSPNSDQGFLVPRITTFQRNAMESSLRNSVGNDGLMVFDTDVNLFYYWNNNNWNAGLGVLNVLAAGGDLEGNYPNPTIKLGAVVEDRIGDLAVSTAKLQNNSVTSGKIDNGAVTTNKIANQAVTGDKLENVGIIPGTYGNQFTVLQLTTDTKGRVIGIAETPILITSTHIANLSILNQDIADGTITISKINPEGNTDRVLTIDGTGQVTWSDRSEFTSSTLATNNIYVGDNAGVAQGLPVSGDVTVTNNGTSADVQLNADVVTANEIAPGAVNTEEIADGQVQTADIANLNVTTEKLAADAVNNSKLADNAVNTENIANGQVQNADLDKSNIPLSGFGAAAASVDLGANKIINLADPTLNQDAATKNYVDTEISNETSTLQAELDATQAGAGLATDGSYNTNTGTNYIDVAGSLDAADDLLDAAIAGVQTDVNTNETDSDAADAALQTELDATQGGAGLNTDGTYTGKTGTNYIDGRASLDAVDLVLDAAIAGVQTDVNTNETDSDAADAALQTELNDTQTGAGLATDGSYNANTGTNYIDAAGSLDAADDLLDAAVAGVAAVGTALQTELDDTQTGAGLATDGSYNANTGTNYIDAAGSLDAADDLLDAAIAGVQADVNTNETDSDAADAALQTELDDTQTGAGLATDGSYNANTGTNYIDAAGSLDAADDLLDAAVAGVAAVGTALQTELDDTQTGAGLATDGSYNANTGTNYIDAAGSLDAADDLLDAAVAGVQTDVNTNETDSDAADAALQTELDDTQTGAGLATDGSYNANTGTNYIDAAGSLDAADDLLDAAVAGVAAVGTALQTELDDTQTGAGLATDGSYNANTGTNYIDAAGSLDAADDLLDAAIAGVQTDVNTNETDSDAADAALQTELDDTQTGAGLATDGSYNANTGTNYIDAAGSLDAADDLLDAAIAGVQTDVNTNETDSDAADAALQTELNDTQTGAGLATDGSYNANTGTNYIDAAGSLDAADDLLDAAVAGVAAVGTALQTELDDTQTGAGLATDGSYNANTGTNYIDAAGSLDAADDLLDAAIAGVQTDVNTNETDSDAADAALQTELNDTQTGAGLATDGSYNANTGTNYIDAAGSLDAADDLLDAAIAGVQTDVNTNETDSDAADAALQTELNDTQTGAGLATDGSYNANTGTNYIDAAGSLDAADDLLDAAVAGVAAVGTALQTELDDTQTGAGLATDGSYNANTGTNYIDAAGSLDAADDLLDAAIAGVQADVNTNETDSDAADAALQTELNDTQTGAGLATDGSYNANTGTNYIDAAGSLDAADDLLDAAVAGVAAVGTALQTELDDTQTGAGLATDGSYNANTGTNYIDAAGSLDAADDLLDAAIAGVQTDVNTNETDSDAADAALQTELDDTQTGAGLATDGSYNANTGTNYIDAAGSLDAADDLLDAAIAGVQTDVNTNETDSDAADAALQTELNDTQTGAGLATDGSYNANTGTNYIDAAGSLDAADDLLDAAVAGVAAVGTALQTELDDTQTGAGLATDGSYNANTGTNYIDAAGSLDAADDLLDAAIAGVQTDVNTNETDSDAADAALQTELNDTQTGAGLATDGSYNANTGTNYIDAAGSLDAADDLLDAAIAGVQTDVNTNETDSDAADAALQTELNDTQTGAGLATDGSYNANTGTNYIDAAGSLDAADDLLDAAVAGVAAVGTALQTELDDTQTGAGLATDGSYNANTGTNYIDAAGSLDAADDLLDAAVAGVAAVGTALQTELDDTQTGAGLATDGSYNANTGTNYIDAAGSLDAADDLLDAAIAGVQADVNTNETDSDAADAALQTELNDTQTGAGLAANGAYNANTGTNYIDAAGSLDAADDLLDAAIAGVATSNAGVQTELDDTQTGAGLATDGSYNANTGTNYIDAAGSLDAADDLLDAAIAGVQTDVNTNETDSDAADAALQTELNDTQTGAGLATDGSYNANTGTNYIDAAGSLDAADDLLDAAIAGVATSNAGVQTELDDTQTGAGLATDGSYNANTGTNYIDAAGSLDAADDLLDAAIAGVATSNAGVQTELDDTQTGAGLATDGSYNANTGTNYIDAAGSLDAADDLLDAAVAGVQTDVNTNETDSDAADAALQTELNDTQTGAGLAANGGYNANTGTNYIDAAGSLDAADDLLDAAIAGVATSNAGVQTELDDTQTGAGLATDGSYNANTGTNYIDAAGSLDAADDLLDAAVAGVQTDVNTNETDSDAADAALQTELNDTQTGAGLAANGGYNANTGTNYIDAAGSLDAADDLLDAAIAGVATSNAGVQTELDDTQTGAGLATDGSYNANTGTNYIDAAGSLDAADDLLDAAIAGVQTDVNTNETDSDAADAALQTELNDTQTGAGLAANGGYNANTGTNYIDAAGSLDAADDLLDAAIAGVATSNAGVQTELDDTQTGAGLATDGSYNANTGTNYIDAAGSLDAADDLLDAAIAGVQTDVNTNETDSDAADAALQTELNDTQTGAGLAANGGYNANTGTNYIDAAGSLDAADDLLDAAIAGVATSNAGVQTELDDTQTGAGLATDGSYNANTGTNYIDAAGSLDAADDLLDAAIAGVQTDVNTNETDSDAADAALQTELNDTQTGAGLAANGAYNANTGTNYIDAAGSLDAADDLLDAAIAGVATSNAGVQTELDDTQTGAGLATDGSYNANTGTNYIDAAGSLDAADDLLDAAIAGVQTDVNTNETDSDAADAALQTELNDTQTGAGLAANGGYNANTGTNYIDAAGSLDAADDLLDAAIAGVATSNAGVQTELDDTQTGAGLATDGSYNANTGTNYIDAAGSLDAADDLLDAAIAGVQTDVNTNETDSDAADAALQTELNDTQMGAGLAANGGYNANTGTNYIDAAGSLDAADDLLDAAIAGVATSNAGVQTELDDTQTGAGLATDGSYNANTGTNYIDAAGSLDAADDLLDAAIAGVQTDVNTNETDSDAADAALQTELNDTQTGAGLATDGSYNANTGTNYIDAAGSLDAADDLLDAAIAGVATSNAGVQTELDDTQTGAGLATDGSYNANTGTNYIDAAGSLDAADDLLDAAIAGVQTDVNTNETDSDAADAALQTELNDTQTGAGLAANGAYNANTGTNYIDAAGSLDAADDLLDAAIAGVATSNAGVQTELDDTQTGAGLATDGSYNANTGTNYIDAAGSLDAADDLLDAAIAGVQTDVNTNETDSDAADAALQTELNDTQTGAGLAANGAYNANTGTNYIDAAGSLDAADDLLDAAIAGVATSNAGVQTELDDTQTGAGLATDGSYNANTGTNYIDAAGSLDAADDLLDAAIAGVQTDVNTNETDSDAADAALQTELNDTQTGAGLAANGGYNANTGTNYIDAAGSLDAADDLLDAAIAGVATSNAGVQTELDDTQTGAGLATDGSYNANTGTNYIDAAGSLDAADDLLDAAIAGVQTDVNTNETDSDAADAALQTELNDTQTGAGLAANGGYNANTGTNYIDAAGSLDAADDLLDAAIAGVATSNAGVQTELDDTQTGAGLATDGSYNANTGTNYIDAAGSLDAADDLLDAAIAGVQTDVNTNETDSDAADAALQTELNDTQMGAGLAANGGYNANTGTNYIDAAGSLDAADDLLDAAIAGVATSNAGVQTELDDTQTGAGLATDGSYNANTGTNYIDAAGSLDAADDLLDAAIAGVQTDVNTNETDSDAADAALQTELNDTQTGAGLATDGSYNANTGTNYIDAAGSLDAADDLLDAAIAGVATSNAGVQTELDDTQTGAGLATDGSYNANTGTNYIDAAGSLDAADDLLDAAIAGVQTDVNTNETDSDAADAALQTELNDTQTGAGLAANGAYNANTGTNYIDAAGSLDAADDLLDAAIAGVATSNAGVQTELDDTQTGAGLATDGSYNANTGTNYIDAAGSLDAADDLLDAAIAGVQTDVNTNETDSDAADAALQTELNDTQTGAGLAANGAYNANTGTNYIDAAGSLDAADDLLDAAIAGVATSNAGVQTELDDTQTGAGLATDGSYNANTGTNYIDAAGSLDAADDLLDAAIAGVQTDVNTNETDSDAADAALQTELNDTQTGAGLAANGGYNANTGTNYIDAAGSLDAADDLLDAAIAGVATSNAGVQTELDDTQTGAGLATDGSYNANTGTNYIDAAGSLDAADDLLDAAIAGVQTDVNTNETDSDAADAALQTELNDTQTGAGLAANGAYNANTGTNYIDAAGSLDAADDLLDAAIAGVATSNAGVQTELDDTQTGAGLATDGSYNANTGTNYIDAAGSLDAADDLLDAAIAGVATDASNLETLSGVGGATDLGIFSGSTITTGSNVKAALQSLETTLEAQTDDQTIDQFNITSNTLNLSLESDGAAPSTVDLSPYLDNTDAQDLTLTGNTLAVSGDPNTDVDLSGYLDNTDAQDLTLTGNTLAVSGDPNTDVDLSGYLDNTDDQTVDQFDITSNTLNLSLESDGAAPSTVDLSPYLDNTDAQDLTLTGNTLAVSGDPNTDVDLSGYLDNTDDQTVDQFNITSNTLNLSLESDGAAPSTVDLSPYLDNTDDQTVDQFDITSNTLNLSLESDGAVPSTVDLSPYLDNTDAQDLTLTGNTLAVSGDPNTDVDLSGYLDNTDDQTVDQFDITSNTLNLSLESDGAAPSTVDLSPYLDNTDAQDLTLIGNTLAVSGDPNTDVDLSGYLDNTDAQDLTLTGNTLAVSGDPNTDVDLSGYLDNTDDQTVDQFNITSNTLNLSLESDGAAPSTVDLSPYLDNTDAQDLTLTGNTLAVSGDPNTDVDLSGYLDNTDDQTVDQFNITSNTLNLSLESDGAAPSTVDLSPYLDNTDDQTVDQFDITSNTLNLSLESDGAAPSTVDLSPYLDNTDAQDLTLTGNTLAVSGDPNTDVDLSGYLDNTDDQTVDQFNITSNTLNLSLESDGAAPSTVDLSPYLDNTDDQTVDQFDITSNTLNLSLESDGTAPSTVDLSPYLDNTDAQDLTLTGNTLAVSGDPNTDVDLSGYLDNTDAQDLTLTGNTLAVSGDPNTDVDLSGYLDNTDDQTVDQFDITSNTLNLSLESDGAAPSTVDLSPYLDNTDAQDLTLTGNTLAVSGDPNTDVDLSGYLDNTDAQDLTLTGNTLAVSGDPNTDVDLSGYLDNTDDQTVDQFDITSNTLNLSLESDGAAPSTVDLSPYLDNTDAQDISYNSASDELTIDNGSTISIAPASDRRLKENIVLLQKTMEKLNKINGYNYNYISDEEKRLQIGVIAQELEKVFPELVVNDENGYKRVRYDGLVPVLIEALKEQQSVINDLNQKVAAQETKLSELASDNKEMKSDLDLIKKMLIGDKTAKSEQE